MNTRQIKGLVILGITAVYSCKKPYSPPAIAANSNYLVVEGVINTGNDSTIFNLSRTVNIGSGKDSTAELGATVAVESNHNASYLLAEAGRGKYAAPPLGLDSTQQYRIDIKTADGKEYVSDFTTVKASPPIDSVGYSVLSDGLQIYVNTHDAKNNTRYYRWDYTEEWRFHAQYYSPYISNGTALVQRLPSQDVYYCFTGDVSSSITLGSSAKLQQDVIYKAPVIKIPSTSEKVELKYSILVKQYALTVDAFNYWQNLKKNTEQLGSIFDAQPSEIAGNIHCTTDPTIPVVGYISAGTVQQKRIFISNQQLPAWTPAYPYNCAVDSILYCQPPLCENWVPLFLINLPAGSLALGQLKQGPTIIGYLGTTQECADCTLRGTKTQPDFWR